jgi:hypothetical protein
MAICLTVDLPGVTQQQYDAILQAMGRSLGSAPEPGQVFHVAGPYAGGWRVVDVWESQAAFDQFLQGQLAAALTKVGIALTAAPDVFEVYNIER